MLYINEKKASRMQNVLHAIYNECKIIKMTIIQYKKYTDLNDKDSTYISNKYVKLFSVMLDSMRYRIIIGMGNLFDGNKKSLSIKKMLSISQQVGNNEINNIIKKIEQELTNYDSLFSNINNLRDKMYAHIDIKYSLEEGDIFDIDFELLNSLFDESLELLNYIMDQCVNISEKYDGDILCLRINRMYDK